MTLLTIVQDAAVLCNLPTPSSVITSTDVNVPLLLRLANYEGKELARRHDWAILTVTDFTFTSVATVEQTAFPTGFDRLLPNPELWNRSTSLKYTGPMDRRSWEQLLSIGITAGSPGWWRFGFINVAPFSPGVLITPAPTAGQTLAITILTNQWAIDAANVNTADSWTVDTDRGLIPERLMTLGIVWRYKKAKGLDYAEDMATYEREVERACTRDRGANIIRPQRSRMDDLPPPTWPGTIV